MTYLLSVYSVIGLLNVLVLAIVSVLTFRRYSLIRSRFTLAMVLFSWLLLVNSIVACPVLLTACGVKCEISSLPFYTVASGAQFVAVLFLVYILAE